MTSDIKEHGAEIIYDAMRRAAISMLPPDHDVETRPPLWVYQGNSTMQDVARRTVDKILPMLIAQLIDDVSDFGSPDPVAESNNNDVIAQVTEHLREKYLT
jgi:hypothetical protein